MLNVGYQPPNEDSAFYLEAVNASASKAFGYLILEYWNFLTSPEAASILENNLDRLWDCAHAGTFEAKKNLYCVPGAMKRYLSDPAVPRIDTKAHGHNEGLKQRWMSQFLYGGLSGALCWYTSRTENIQFASDKKIPDSNIVIAAPTLFIGCSEDTVCRTEMINGPRDAGLLPNLKVEQMNGVGHWPMYERPEQTADNMLNFLKDKDL